MFTFLTESAQVRMPRWVKDLESFRRWADTDDVPEKTCIWFLKGDVWVDLSREQVFSHGAVRTEFTRGLAGLATTDQSGLFLGAGALWSNEAADVGGKPDRLFASNEALQSGRVRLVEEMGEDYLEIEGSPDMVLEVVSPSSVRKDTVTLRQAYWEAGVREYWLVDARKEPLSFEVLRRTARGFAAARKQQGWVKSAVFGKEFRLVQRTTPLGHPDYTLEVR